MQSANRVGQVGNLRAGCQPAPHQRIQKQVVLRIGRPAPDSRSLLERLGFEERIRGSHLLFRKAVIEERINLRRDGNNAKPYQVKQVRFVILKHKLGEHE